MRIGYLLQSGVPDLLRVPPPGPAVHVQQVFHELQELGHEVCLLAYLNNHLWKSTDLENFSPVSVKYLDWQWFQTLEFWIYRIQSVLHLPRALFFKSVRFALACRQELGDCDIFLERMGWMGYGGALASQWLDIPLVLEVNGDHLDELQSLGMVPKGIQRRLSVTLMQNAVQRADHVVATGAGWRERFIDRWDVDPALVDVVENGSMVVNLLERDQLQAFRPCAPAAEPVTIVYVGAFEPWHGINILLRAVAKAAAEGANVRLKLIGSGTELTNIQTMIHKLGIFDLVTLTGQLAAPQLAQHLAQADIGASPYCGRVEYSGLKLLDYKAAGLVTIASGQDGQPAVLKHGCTGWIVPPCDVDALCAAIVKLSADPQLRRQMGRTARIEAEECHSWRATARQLEAIFTRIVESNA